MSPIENVVPNIVTVEVNGQQHEVQLRKNHPERHRDLFGVQLEVTSLLLEAERRKLSVLQKELQVALEEGGSIKAKEHQKQELLAAITRIQAQHDHLEKEYQERALGALISVNSRGGGKNVQPSTSFESLQEPSVKEADEEAEVEPVLDGNKRNVMVQTDWDMEYVEKLLSDMVYSTEKIAQLCEKLKCVALDEETFINNDKKALYFTGFPTASMMFLVFKYTKDYLSSKSALLQFQQFLLTLMRLRLNLPFKYLSYRFAVSSPTASATFYKCIDIFYERFKSFIVWPKREILQQNMPQGFKDNFGQKVAVIIDCFEIFTENPSSIAGQTTNIMKQ